MILGMKPISTFLGAQPKHILGSKIVNRGGVVILPGACAEVFQFSTHNTPILLADDDISSVAIFVRVAITSKSKHIGTGDRHDLFECDFKVSV
ncbi:MAG: hypothetical protein CMK38_00060 [Porticoccaceae bacterium]|nr:hypothetical protein [Porticoccaceae bacterium]